MSIKHLDKMLGYCQAINVPNSDDDVQEDLRVTSYLLSEQIGNLLEKLQDTLQDSPNEYSSDEE